MGLIDDLEDTQRRLQALEGHTVWVRHSRDDLIRKCLAAGYTEREVAAVASVAPSYVNKVRNRKVRRRMPSAARNGRTPRP